MSNPKSRVVPDALSMYIVMLIIYCIDIFFFKSDLTVLGDAFYSRFFSLAIIFVYMWVTKTPLDTLGISRKRKKFATGAVYGTIFAVVPLITVMAVECIFYGITDITALNLRFAPPSLSHVRDVANLTPGIAIAIYAFTTFFGSVFKEFFFRGYMLKKLKKATSFKTANIIQALLYMSLTLPMLLRNLVNHYYDNTTASLGAFIVGFYIIHETLAGLKWGLLTRVTGSTYTAIVDHTLYVFLSNSVFITNRYVTWSFMLHNLAIQVVSTIIVYIYYRINMKKLEEKRAKEKEERAAKRKEHIERRKERERNNIIDEKIQEIHEISPEQFKDIVSEANDKNHRHHHRHHSEAKTQQRNEKHSKQNEELFEEVSTADASKRASEYLGERMSSTHHHRHHHSSEKTNEEHSKHNEELFEEVSTADASKRAGEYLGERMNSSHHHHHHHYADNGDKLESFSAGDAAKKTEMYSDSLSLERKTPKHPHPHDKMARDSLLSTEELEKANADKMDGYSEDAIDDFLKNFSENMSAETTHHHHRHHHHRSETQSADYEVTEDVPENFDADSFLKDFRQDTGSSSHQHHSHHSSGSHHHHHSSHRHYREDAEIVSMSEVSTEEFFDEYQKTVEEKKAKKKQKFINRVRELGLVDDSASNDLL